jgi:Reverse transcriptase (RNA-dependent DNA polymerase)
LGDLKKNVVANFGEISRIETELASQLEEGLKGELENMKIFDRLNNERITPYFLNLAKTISSNDSLTLIKENTGTAFREPSAQEEYITGFYRDLYKKPHNEQDCSVQQIEHFLGDTANIPEVENSKLSENEKNYLERDISIHELDCALNSSNKKSAPGIDGFSYKFITTFWKFLRIPLLNYTKCCLENGKLTNSFRTAKIRLIPKKGAKDKIGNWRPISLLSCFYKIISRVFATRLKRVIDKVTSVGQKGYSKTKQCQEVLISLITGIEKCKKLKKRGALISLDIKKAFDSVSHSFLKSALKFFNFGDKFIANFMTLCTNRMASIIFDNNKMGKSFALERGNAQGDTISPFLFNICYQLLIFKINYDLQIESILEVPVVPDTHQPLAPPVSKKPRKIFAFADDGTILTIGTKFKSYQEHFGKFWCTIWIGV